MGVTYCRTVRSTCSVVVCLMSSERCTFGESCGVCHHRELGNWGRWCGAAGRGCARRWARSGGGLKLSPAGQSSLSTYLLLENHPTDWLTDWPTAAIPPAFINQPTTTFAHSISSLLKTMPQVICNPSTAMAQCYFLELRWQLWNFSIFQKFTKMVLTCNLNLYWMYFVQK